MRVRFASLDIMKFVATIAIFNHLAACYFGKWTFLASGGAIGCALFFFCSGFALALGKVDRFDKWYRRRVGRLWPTCFMALLAKEILFDYNGGGVTIAIKGLDWFVTYILLFYVIFWLSQQFMARRDCMLLLISTILIVGYGLFEYPFVNPGRGLGVTLFGYNIFYNRMVYLLPFQLGVLASYRRERARYRPVFDGLMMIAMFIAFYLFYFIAGRNALVTRLQIVIVLPLLGFVYFFWKFVSSGFWTNVMRKHVVSPIILFIGGLSLEMYLIGSSVRHWIPVLPFPIGYLLGFVSAVALSYFVRSAGRMFAQTFIPAKLQDGYDWIAIFRPY